MQSLNENTLKHNDFRLDLCGNRTMNYSYQTLDCVRSALPYENARMQTLIQ